MPESKTDHARIKSASLNELQAQVLKNELFGHPTQQKGHTVVLRSRGMLYSVSRLPSFGTILQFKPRSIDS